MRNSLLPLSALVFAIGIAPQSGHAASLQEAATALNAADIRSIEFVGAGHWFQFGQAPNPNAAWPQFDVSSYDALINYETKGAHVKIVRKQTVDPNRQRPTPVEQSIDQYVSVTDAWNVTPPAATAQAGTPPTTTPQLSSAEERLAEIWATPQGFLKAALANGAASKASGSGVDISFTVGGKYRYEGTINAQNQVEKVRTWIDSPVLGDTLVETTFSDYKDFGGVQFPAHVVRAQGGYPVLDLAISSVKPNPDVDITVPGVVANFHQPSVAVSKLADGVFYLTGGTHHSVAIEQKDHVVLVEAPLSEDRSLALIAKIHEIIPNKPIKYVINSHVHFDHAGGLRTLVNDGAIVVTHQLSKAYYENVWANPHSINPDLLSKSKKVAKFQTYTDKLELSDGKRKIDVHLIAGSGHSDDLGLVYLPAEKILIEGDAFTVAAAGAPVPASPNPYSVNLYENIQKLKLNVEQIAGLHGPRVATLADLRTAIGQVASAQ